MNYTLLISFLWLTPFHHNQCNYKNTTTADLQLHISTTHQEALLKCNQCNYTTTTTTDLQLHIRTTHKEALLTCNQCNYRTMATTDLQLHISTTHQEALLTCNQCNYRTTTQYSLEKHKETSHENHKNREEYANKQEINKKSNYVSKRIQCQKCSKKFNKKETFRTHIQTHHGNIIMNIDDKLSISNINNGRPSHSRPRRQSNNKNSKQCPQL